MVRKLALLGALLVKIFALYAADIDISSGYRRGHLTWNIAIERVDVLSELRWSELEIWELRGRVHRPLGAKWDWEAFIGGGPILKGRGRDSDYDQSGRQREFSRSYADTKGYLVDASLLFGRPTTARCLPALSVTPEFGLSWNRQAVRDFNAVSVIDSMYDFDDRPFESFPTFKPFGGGGTVCRFAANWVMLVSGLRLSEAVSPKVTWEATGHVKPGVYIGRGDWVLRDMVFYHTASAIGLEGRIRWYWRLRPTLTLFCSVDGQYHYAWDGVELLVLPEGNYRGPDLNEAIWQSFGVAIGIHQKF